MNDEVKMTPLIPFGVLNKNNRRYTKECIKNLPKSVPIVREMKGIEEIDPSDIVGSASIHEKEDGIYITDCNITDPSYSAMVQEMMNRGGRFVPAGIGNVEEDGTIKDFELREISFTMDPSW